MIEYVVLAICGALRAHVACGLIEKHAFNHFWELINLLASQLTCPKKT